jgi:cyclase
MGDIVELALRYRDEGADELVFYDITASPEGRSGGSWLGRAGGAGASISRSAWPAASARGRPRDRVLYAGADKVSVNTPALERPALISELAEAFGVQCVVVGIDSIREADGEWRVRSHTGDPDETRAGQAHAGLGGRGAALGAGEIVLNCMDSDGVRGGYDIEQLRAVRARLRGAAGRLRRCRRARAFRRGVPQADVDAALAASVFHSGAIAIPALKQALRAARHRGAVVTRTIDRRSTPTSRRWTGTSRAACCRRSCRTRTPCAC